MTMKPQKKITPLPPLQGGLTPQKQILSESLSRAKRGNNKRHASWFGFPNFWLLTTESCFLYLPTHAPLPITYTRDTIWNGFQSTTHWTRDRLGSSSIIHWVRQCSRYRLEKISHLERYPLSEKSSRYNNTRYHSILRYIRWRCIHDCIQSDIKTTVL